jgi:hypothetical protein
MLGVNSVEVQISIHEFMDTVVNIICGKRGNE